MLIGKKNFMALLHIEYKIPMLQILNQRSIEHKKLAKSSDGGVDAMKNSFYPIEFRVKEERLANMLGHIVHVQ